MVAITASRFAFEARFEDDTAPETVPAFRRMPPLDSKIIHPGELVFQRGGVSEAELLLAYGDVAFASKAGALAGNHFATIVEGAEDLRGLGRRMLWDGAQALPFREA